MPYFIQKQDDQFCVLKGTEDEPGDTVSCHDTRNEAMGHMRALYANAEDSKATLSPTVGSLIHGSGGILNPMRDGDDDNDDEKITCTCPKCGYESTGTTECKDRKCAKCESKMSESNSKATWDSAYITSLPDSAFLYVEPGEGGKRHLPYRNAEGEIDLPHLRNALSRLGQPATGKGWLTESLRKKLVAKAQKLLKSAGGGDDAKSVNRPDRLDITSQLTVYKSADVWRWLAISNVAVRDREGEIITRKAYDDAIAYARANTYGELDLVHVEGTDVGACDLMHRLDDKLIEGGYWFDTKSAERARIAVQSDPDHWGVSIKFQYDPSQFDGSVYHGGIRVLKRSVLPRHMAASRGTAIVATGGKVMKQLDEETKVALAELGRSEEEIEALAEAQKAIEEPNVKVKEDETEIETSEPDVAQAVTVSVKESPTKGFLSDIANAVTKWFSPDETDATTTPEPEPITEPAVTEQPLADKEVEPEEAQDTQDVQNVMKSFTEAITKSVAELVAPLQATITQQAETLSSMEKRLAEAEKDVETKVLARIESIPPVAKVRASQVQSTVTDAPAVGLDPIYQKKVQSAVKQLMADIATEVEHKVSTGQYQV